MNGLKKTEAKRQQYRSRADATRRGTPGAVRHKHKAQSTQKPYGGKWLDNPRYTSGMAKRPNQDIKNRESRSRKTGKRLAAKKVMIAKKGVRRGSVKFRKRVK
ncbi:MAG: hypothetical protein P4L81_05625 [Candidatus Pacebacteria bacterium]|nr:hypothetical protein [Candidatus Paceibacterota bacterium]